MPSILMVEDSALLGSVVSNRLQQEFRATTVWVTTFEEAVEVLVDGGQQFDYAIVDLNLPDVQGMEIVDLVIGHGITAIIFTADCSDNTRDQLWQRKVADYVLEEGGHNIDYLFYLIKRLEANRGVKAVLMDDSSLYRKQISGLLRTQNLTVLDALREQISQTAFAIAGVEIRVTVSIGFAASTELDLKALAALADSRLYEAKALGRNCVVAGARP